MINMRGELINVKEAVKLTRSVANAIPQAYYSALNRTAQRVRTESSREVRKVYTARDEDVRNRVKLNRSSARKATAEVIWKGANIPIIRFRTNPKKVPKLPPPVLKVAVKKSGLKPLKGAFVARVGKGGHVGVFKRAGRKRLPIEEVFGPAVPVMVGNETIINTLKEVAVNEMQKRLDHEIKRVLDKKGASELL